MTDDKEPTSLNAEHLEGWHVTRLGRSLDAARSQAGAYPIVAGDVGDLTASTRFDRDGLHD